MTIRKFCISLSVLFLITPLFTGAQNTFTISGTVPGTNHVWAYLNYLPDNNPASRTDSALVSNNSFKITGHIISPTIALLYIDSPRFQVLFMFEPGVTEIAADILKPGATVIKGGPANKLLNQYQLGADNFNKYRQLLSDSISGPNAPKDSLIHTQLMDRYYTSLSAEEDYASEFIKEHPDSYASAWILYSKFSGEDNINKGIALFKLLSPAVQKSKYTRLMLERAELFRQSNTGKPAPDFAQPDTLGKPIYLHDFKGRYVLVDFWASWCGPCRRENPGLVKAYKQFHEKGFDILSVSLDEKKGPWLKAIGHDQLNWTHVSDLKGWDNTALQLYGVTMLPTNFLVNKEGTIVAKNLFGDGLKDKLQEIFGKQ
jgi:peroxiredoxin